MNLTKRMKLSKEQTEEYINIVDQQYNGFKDRIPSEYTCKEDLITNIILAETELYDRFDPREVALFCNEVMHEVNTQVRKRL